MVDKLTLSKFVNPIFVAVIIFVVLFAIKLIMVSSIVGPSIIDEFYHMNQAQTVFNGLLRTLKMSDTHTPLYPILISPAFLAESPSDYFRLILVLNIIISSIVYPLTLYAAKMCFKFSWTTSVTIAVATYSLPQMTVYSFLVATENGAITLAFMTFILILSILNNDRLYKWIFLGLCLGLLTISRKEFIAILALFLLVTVVLFIKRQAVAKKFLLSSLIGFLFYEICNKLIFANSSSNLSAASSYLSTLMYLNSSENISALFKIGVGEVMVYLVSIGSILFYSILFYSILFYCLKIKAIVQKKLLRLFCCYMCYLQLY
jgi:hypothetical protein